MPLAPKSPLQEGASTRPRVLVVDYDLSLRLSVAELLGDACDVVGVSSVEAALARLRAATFDVVLSEFEMMDGATGAHLVAYVREKHPGVMLLLMTARPLEASRATAAYKEHVQILAKPCEPTMLKRWVGRAANLASMRRAAMKMRADRPSGIMPRRSPGGITSARILWVVLLEAEPAVRQAQLAKLDAGSLGPNFDRVSVLEVQDREACLGHVSGIKPHVVIADGHVLGPGVGEWLSRVRTLPAGRGLRILVTRAPVVGAREMDPLCHLVVRPVELDKVLALIG